MPLSFCRHGGGIQKMDITRSGSQPSGKGSAKNSTGNAGSDSRFEIPDLVSAQHLPSSAARLYEAWHKAGKPVELHIFAKGYHGFGMKKQNLLTDQWIELLKNWLAAQGYLSPAAGG